MGTRWRDTVLRRRQEILDERSKNMPRNSNRNHRSKQFKPNEVKVVDQSYLDKMFNPTTEFDRRILGDIITDFHLNSEQERAFRIIANHATMEDPDKLRMYLGGMGGTGKSQVIKALMKFFEMRNEK